MHCRHCKRKLNTVFINLGKSPPSNSYLKKNELDKKELYFPLNVLVCKNCWLVQTEDFTNAKDLFNNEYAYFSSYSTSWVIHAKKYCSSIVNRFNLNSNSLVIEVASNDGYLLQFFKEKNISCLGIEPTKNTAAASRKKGIKTITEFFSSNLAIKLKEKNKLADLMVGNNVLAHVPDINDFLIGFSILLKTTGVATFEFPHLINLIQKNQFDTIYHEHFSYLSLTSINSIMKKNNLEIFDVNKLATHGGSLRVYVQKKLGGNKKITKRVSDLLESEDSLGINSVKFYNGFFKKSTLIKNEFINFLNIQKKQGKKVAAYGAAAKGNTLLNYAGIKDDLIAYVVDKNPSKQNKYMPGSHIKIVDENYLKKDQPDFIIILPWNLIKEIKEQLYYTKKWNAKFVTAIPSLKIFK